jgi:hypothetical protein
MMANNLTGNATAAVCNGFTILPDPSKACV